MGLLFLAVYAIIGHFFYKLLRHIGIQVYAYKFATQQNLKELAKTNWAAVTGATDGIGKAYAMELAKNGFNVVLISRTPSRLEKARAEIAAKYPNAQLEVVTFDFSETRVEEYVQKLKQPLEKVGFLVNNVGHAPDYPDYLHKIPGGMQTNRNTCIVNTLSAVMMTQMVVESMVQRGGGVIVNVGSSASSHTFFFWSTYSASKKFLHQFTDCLRCEYPTITFQNLTPGWVVAGVKKERRPWKVLSPEEYAESAIKTVGVVENTRGHWAHQLDFDVTLCLPTPVVNYLLGNMLTARKHDPMSIATIPGSKSSKEQTLGSSEKTGSHSSSKESSLRPAEEPTVPPQEVPPAN